MKNFRKFTYWILFLLSLYFVSCKPAAKQEAEPAVDARTPVTVVNVSNEPLTEYIELNAVSQFLQKNYVKATTNGYLQSVDAYPGKYVEKGKVLFTLKTKEAQSIGNSISILDSALKFSGLISIKANENGYITQLNHQTGDYVQDGEQLAAISDMKSFVFLLNLPYELRPLLLNRKAVELILPDGEKLNGQIASTMPTVDSASQTQSIVVKVNPSHPIPENLIAKVKIIKAAKSKAISLPKTAVLSNETQDDFWVMKMIDSSTAVKVPIKKGIETADRVEVVSPPFSIDDKILTSGNYGLPDTAKVKIVQ
jgi:multidrug efflux pump subunit AcrA (membrane-fusion protein)